VAQQIVTGRCNVTLDHRWQLRLFQLRDKIAAAQGCCRAARLMITKGLRYHLGPTRNLSDLIEILFKDQWE